MRLLYLAAFFFNVFTVAMWTLFLYIGHAAPSLMAHFRIGYAIAWSVVAVLCAVFMFVHLMQYEDAMKKVADGLEEANEILKSTLEKSRKPSDIGPAPMTTPAPYNTGFMGGCECPICTSK